MIDPPYSRPNRGLTSPILNLLQTKYDYASTLGFRLRGLRIAQHHGLLFNYYDLVYDLVRIIQSDIEGRIAHNLKKYESGERSTGRPKEVRVNVPSGDIESFMRLYFGGNPPTEWCFSNGGDEFNDTVFHTLGILQIRPRMSPSVVDDTSFRRVGGWRRVNYVCPNFSSGDCGISVGSPPLDACSSCAYGSPLMQSAENVNKVSLNRYTSLLRDVRMRIDEVIYKILYRVHSFLEAEGSELPAIVGDVSNDGLVSDVVDGVSGVGYGE